MSFKRIVTCDVDHVVRVTDVLGCLFCECDCSVLRLLWPRPAGNAYALSLAPLSIPTAMKRTPSRAPSPTPTAFSGISNYRTDSYRPVRDTKGAPAVPTIDYRQVSRIHYTELGKYLASYLAAGTSCLIISFHSCLTGVFFLLLSSSEFSVKC